MNALVIFRRNATMVTIRLSRGGTNKIPFYCIVVANSRSKRDGRFIEALGTWDPCDGEGKLVLDRDRFEHWVKLGAQPSEVVSQLAKRAAKSAAKA
jgi:small subunit ribosomal protein S16